MSGGLIGTKKRSLKLAFGCAVNLKWGRFGDGLRIFAKGKRN